MKNLSNSELISKLIALSAEERRITIEVLRHLKEVESRRLHLEKGFKSLHEFCVRELKYSSGAAHRRIESMQLLRDVPEAEEKVLKGDLNLTTLTQVQSYVRHERKENARAVPIKEKQELLAAFCGKSKLQVERVLVARAPSLAERFNDSVRPISETEMAVKFIADQELMDLLKEVKAVGGTPGEDLCTIFKRLARHYIHIRKKATQRTSNSPLAGPQSRHIRKAEQIAVRHRGVQCSYTDKNTGRSCSATENLQFDHVRPYAKGGTTSRDNLQLLCPAHNRFKAIQDFGERKMSAFLGKG